MTTTFRIVNTVNGAIVQLAKLRKGVTEVRSTHNPNGKAVYLVDNEEYSVLELITLANSVVA